MNANKNILVCGAGQGGHAIAGYAATQGYEVSLYTHTDWKAQSIQQQGNKIVLSGIIEGEGQLRSVSSSLEDVVAGDQKIIIVTDATAHRHYARELAPLLTNQDITLISPGIGGALEFYAIVNRLNPDANVTVSETDTLVYACKMPQIGHSYIKTEKKELLLASASPSNQEPFFTELYLQTKNTSNPLMGIDDSPVFHIVGMVENAQRILNAEDFNFYIDGITPRTADLMERMDSERCQIAQALGIKPRTVRDWLNAAYGVPMADLYTMVQNTPPYQNTAEVPNRSPAPKTLFHRYLLEEIPLRAVPTSRLGDVLGIRTPIYDDMIARASKLTGIHFPASGRRLRDMGLTPHDILHWHRNFEWKV